MAGSDVLSRSALLCPAGPARFRRPKRRAAAYLCAIRRAGHERRRGGQKKNTRLWEGRADVTTFRSLNTSRFWLEGLMHDFAARLKCSHGPRLWSRCVSRSENCRMTIYALAQCRFAPLPPPTPIRRLNDGLYHVVVMWCTAGDGTGD